MSMPKSETLHAETIAAAAGADQTTVIGRAPFAGTISAVTYVPSAAIAGAATNNRTVTVKNKGAAGSGTKVPATLGFVNAVNAAAFVEKAIPLSGTPADLVVAAGDILEFESVHVGTGIADPGGDVIVTLTRGDVSV